MRDYKTIRVQVEGFCDDLAVTECEQAGKELAEAIKQDWDIMYIEKDSIWKLYHLVKAEEYRRKGSK